MLTDTRDVLVLVRPLLPSLDKLNAALSGVLESGVLTNDGPRVRALEALLSTALGIDELAVCGSGTTAIQLACAALDMTGDVLVPAAAFPAAAQAVLRAGGRPIAVDVDRTYLTIDPAAVEAAITRRTKGILAVHTFGCPADIEALTAIARSARIPLVFDGAPGWGVSYHGRPLLSYGDASTLSLHATKLTHSIEGGAVMSTTRPVAERVRRLRNFGMEQAGASPAGTNARMSELHAAVGAAVLSEAAAEVARRVAVRDMYRQALRDISWLSLCDFRPGAGPNVAALPVRLGPDAPFEAEELCRELLAHRVHARAYFAGRYRFRPLATVGPTPNATAATRRIACLPFWGGLTERDVSRVADALQRVHAEHRRMRVSPPLPAATARTAAATAAVR